MSQSSRRRDIPEIQKRVVWARSAGRCAVCKRNLTEGALTSADMTVGELAHIVGQQATVRSPRGMSDMSAEDRDSAANLILICAGEHREIDRAGAVEVMTIERLDDIKRRHEDWVERVTGLATERRTAVVRMIGTVRGISVDVSRELVTDAVIAGEARFPDFPLAFDRYGVELDLRELPGEADADHSYWSAAKAKIDEVVEQKLAEGVRRDQIDRVSVFAFARLPLLVYLGSKLDDAYPVSIYQRHRSTERWEWPSEDAIEFEVLPADSAADEEAVLMLSVSGSIDAAELPLELQSLPTFEIRPAGGIPEPDAVASRASLAVFEAAVRRLFSEIEASHKSIRRLHVLAALPLSAAVVLGRAHDRHVHPVLAVYDRTATGYRIALEIG